MLGMQEELGELAHALLKQRQGIRASHAEHEASARDAMGDLLVYMLDMCNKRGWNLEDILQTTWDEVKQRNWILHPDLGTPPIPEQSPSVAPQTSTPRNSWGNLGISSNV